MMTILLVIVAAAWTQLKAHALWALVVLYGESLGLRLVLQQAGATDAHTYPT